MSYNEDILNLQSNKRIWRLYKKELESFLGKKIGSFDEEYIRISKSCEGEEDALYACGDRDKISGYYSRTQKYLFELLRWEATYDKQENFKRVQLFLQNHKLKNILDFGGGIGGLCIYLDERGFKCDYADIAGLTFDFAQYRFLRRKSSVRSFNLLEGWPADGSYEAICTYDVLEHLPSLPEKIERISRLLETGGYLISKSTFSGGGLHLKENEQYIDLGRFNELLSGYGLNYAGRIKDSYFTDFLQFFKLHGVFGIRIKKDKKTGGCFLLHQKTAKP